MKRPWLVLPVCLLATLSYAQIQITLNKNFIQTYADRATIDANFRVDTLSKIHPPSQDGDIHVAGTAPEIGMIAVAEVMNAKSERTKAVKVLTQAAQSHGSVTMTGAWRIWSEHGGDQDYIQGDPVPVAQSSGEAHVFEIHPLTKVDGEDITHTLEPIAGYTYKSADDAFNVYERTRCKISESGNTVTISTEKSGYNYTEFIARLRLEPRSLSDGTEVLAGIYDLNGELLVKERRLIFAKGTPPEQVIQGMHKDQYVQVLGIPRVSLKLVDYRLTHRTGRFADALNWNLPYEMIVAAVTDDSPNVPTQ